MVVRNKDAVKKFNKAFADFSSVSRDKTNDMLRRIAFACDTLIVMRMPVDTGNARFNWRVAVNTIDTTYTFYPRGSVPDVSTRDTSAINKFQVGDYITIANTTPYILALEHGTSRQSPKGMVGITLADMANKIEMGAFDGS